MNNTTVAVEESFVSEIVRVNFLLDHEGMDFVGYEFVTAEDILIEESDCEQDLFRLDIDKKTGEIEVYCAYSEDFDIMEEATHHFDTEKLLENIKAWIEERKGTDDEVGNQGQAFVKYVKLCDEGYDCHDAILMCYKDEDEE